MTFVVLLAGLGLGLSVVALMATATGRWQPKPTAAGPGRMQHRALAIWEGPYRRTAQRRAHQKRLMIGAVAGVVLWLVTGMPVIGIAAMLAVPGVPWLLGGGQLEKAAIERLEAIQAWTLRLTSLVVTGTGLQQSIIASVESAPAEIVEEIRDLAARLQAGDDPREALLRFADALDDESADAVVASLLQHLSTRGAGLRDALTDIAATTADQIMDRRDVYAERGRSRSALKWLTMMVAGVLAVGPLVGDYGRAYSTGVGQLVLFGAVGMLIVFLLKARQLTVPGKSVRFLATGLDSPGVDFLQERA